MHRLIEEHPTYAALVKERQALTDAEQRSGARVRAVMEPYWAKQAAWQAEADDALRTGQEPTQPPRAPDLGADRDASGKFTRWRAELQERERQVLAEIAPDVEEAAAVEEQATLQALAEAVALLRDGTQEVSSLMAAVRTVRTAVDTADPNSRPVEGLLHRTRRSVDVHDVIDAVRQGESLLALAPKTLHANTHDETKGDGYSLTPQRVFGTPPKMEPVRVSRPGEI